MKVRFKQEPMQIYEIYDCELGKIWKLKQRSGQYIQQMWKQYLITQSTMGDNATQVDNNATENQTQEGDHAELVIDAVEIPLKSQIPRVQWCASVIQ